MIHEYCGLDHEPEPCPREEVMEVIFDVITHATCGTRHRPEEPCPGPPDAVETS